MSGGIIGAQDDGPPDPLHREVVAADLVSHKPEEVERVGVVRLDREDLAIKRLGLRQSSGLVVLICRLKRL